MNEGFESLPPSQMPNSTLLKYCFDIQPYLGFDSDINPVFLGDGDTIPDAMAALDAVFAKLSKIPNVPNDPQQPLVDALRERQRLLARSILAVREKGAYIWTQDGSETPKIDTRITNTGPNLEYEAVELRATFPLQPLRKPVSCLVPLPRILEGETSERAREITAALRLNKPTGISTPESVEVTYRTSDSLPLIEILSTPAPIVRPAPAPELAISELVTADPRRELADQIIAAQKVQIETLNMPFADKKAATLAIIEQTVALIRKGLTQDQVELSRDERTPSDSVNLPHLVIQRYGIDLDLYTMCAEVGPKGMRLDIPFHRQMEAKLKSAIDMLTVPERIRR